MSADSAADEAPVNISVRCPNGTKVPVSAPLSSTVATFKALLAANCDVPAEQQRLIYKGRILKDDQTLRSYGVESDHTIHLVRGSAQPAPSNSSNGTNTGSLKHQNNSPIDGDGSGRAHEDGGLGNASLGSSLFTGLGGSGGASDIFGAGLPNFSQMQQQLTQNPSMMREMMNMPFIQNLINNPDILRNFITSNPQMREIIDRNPELAHILNDPNTLRQTLEATRNPELMREMMRNTDRAMSNIESSPEGFNMLRRLYENVQEPLLNATTMAAERGNDNPTRERSATPSATTGLESTAGSPAPNTTPLPNPWNNTPGSGGRTNSTIPPPASDARAAGLPGLLGLGLPDLQQGMPDSSLFSQFMQNSATSQIMQNLLSNPQYVNQLLSINPEMRSLMENNPQLREMVQNPEFLRQLASPETLRHMLALQQSLSALGIQQPGQGQNLNGAASLGSLNNLGLDQLLGMLSGLGLDGVGAPNSNVPPEERYATQLSQLQEMGFFDTQENIRALLPLPGMSMLRSNDYLGTLGSRLHHS